MAFFGAMTRTGLRIINHLGLAGTVLDPARSWTKDRAPLQVPSESFRTQWAKQGKERNAAG
jgi:hypothetical protein